MDAVLLIGMHRSGTSCLAGCLQELGLHLGEVHQWNRYNPKGNRERRDVMALNDALLADHGGRWDAPLLIVEGAEERGRARDRIIAELAASGRPWGFKDPRTLFTLPFWLRALPQARLVGTFRQPMAVAASLMARNQFSLEQSLRLWARYNHQLLVWAEAYAPALIPFDLEPTEYRERLRGLARWLRLPGDAGPEFLDPALRRQSGNDLLQCPAEHQRLYQQLMAHAEQFWNQIR